ncbi:SSU ribosomal protein S2p (SAe) [Rhodovastum atsumiense]|nr:SSU ribosomal protein S2p (SAe) [Rhodovastum atsumiense]
MHDGTALASPPAFGHIPPAGGMGPPAIHTQGAFRPEFIGCGSGAVLAFRPAEAQPDGRKDTLMAMPEFTLRQLLEAGVHFGHHTRRWNPRMAPFLFGVRNQVHIIDLQQTVPMLDRSLRAIRDVVAAGGRVLFVGTKRAAADYVADSARRCGQYYVNHRWLGGMLTNWKTITGSIKRLRQIDEMLAGDTQGLTKKEILDITRDREKLERALGGIKDMGGLPDILFIIDTNKEKLAVEEANKLGIPVVAVLDSNSDPSGVTFPIPGNDDAIRAITLYCDLVAGAVLDGISAEMIASGRDIGAAEDLPPESLPETAPAAETAPQPAAE